MPPPTLPKMQPPRKLSPLDPVNTNSNNPTTQRTTELTNRLKNTCERNCTQSKGGLNVDDLRLVYRDMIGGSADKMTRDDLVKAISDHIRLQQVRVEKDLNWEKKNEAPGYAEMVRQTDAMVNIHWKGLLHRVHNDLRGMTEISDNVDYWNTDISRMILRYLGADDVAQEHLGLMDHTYQFEHWPELPPMPGNTARIVKFDEKAIEKFEEHYNIELPKYVRLVAQWVIKTRKVIKSYIERECKDVDVGTLEPFAANLDTIVLKNGCYNVFTIAHMIKSLPSTRVNIGIDGKTPIWDSADEMNKIIDRIRLRVSRARGDAIKKILDNAARGKLRSALDDYKLKSLISNTEIMLSEGNAFRDVITKNWSQAWVDRWDREVKEGEWKAENGGFEVPNAIANPKDAEAQQMRDNMTDIIKPVALGNIMEILEKMNESEKSAMDAVVPGLFNSLIECAGGLYCVMVLGVRLRTFLRELRDARPSG